MIWYESIFGAYVSKYKRVQIGYVLLLMMVGGVTVMGTNNIMLMQD